MAGARNDFIIGSTNQNNRWSGVAPPHANNSAATPRIAKNHTRAVRRAASATRASSTGTAPRYSVWSLKGFVPQYVSRYPWKRGQTVASVS